jgi:tungstate transport system substrate-binding protein
MYNDFVILGPASDPAGVRGGTSAAKALQQIAATSAPFVSRGDKSGTHVAELLLWKTAGVQPDGAWYKIYEKGNEGNAATLKYTDQQQAYTVIDRATYLSLKNAIKLVVLTEGDEALLNRISVIPINPKKFPKANLTDTMTFVAWLTAPDKGQKLISEYGKEKYGSQLFFPDSRQWHEKNKK